MNYRRWTTFTKDKFKNRWFSKFFVKFDQHCYCCFVDCVLFHARPLLYFVCWRILFVSCRAESPGGFIWNWYKVDIEASSIYTDWGICLWTKRGSRNQTAPMELKAREKGKYNNLSGMKWELIGQQTSNFPDQWKGMWYGQGHPCCYLGWKFKYLLPVQKGKCF